MFINNAASYPFLFGIIVDISLCRYVFLKQSQAYGIVLFLFLTIIIYSLLAGWEADIETGKCAEKLSLIPLSLILTSSLPWFILDPPYQPPAIYTAVLFLSGLHIFREHLTLEELGLQKGSLILGSVLGIFWVIFDLQSNCLLRDLFSMILFAGMTEELLYRGIIQKSFRTVMGPGWSIFMTSLLFTVTHTSWQSGPDLLLAYGVGSILGVSYEKTGSLLVPILIHGACAAIMGL